jgi:hypothetical protein
MAAMQGMMSKLKLTVNEERTRLCLLPEESFDPPTSTLRRTKTNANPLSWGRESHRGLSREDKDDKENTGPKDREQGKSSLCPLRTVGSSVYGFLTAGLVRPASHLCARRSDDTDAS